MPRDLHAIAKEDTLQGMPQLTKSPDEVEGHANEQRSGSGEAAKKPAAMDDERAAPMDAYDEDQHFRTPPSTLGLSKRDQLHPYTQSLSINDVDSCTMLEEETFPPHERASKEKVRLHALRLSSPSLPPFILTASAPSRVRPRSAPPVALTCRCHIHCCMRCQIRWSSNSCVRRQRMGYACLSRKHVRHARP